jgi:hypothetical protein
VSYFGFDNQVHQGALIVNKKIAPEVSIIFKNLLQQRFPIQKIQPAYIYKGDDQAAMADNDTSAFNCRPITGQSKAFSMHSYGIAIDINPVMNPYVKGNIILPTAGKAYLDRSKNSKGMIHKNDAVYNLFEHYGWQWGGNWQSLKDYQHFEKLNT